MKNLFLGLLLMLSACSHAQSLDPIIEPELLPYKQDFELIIGQTKNTYKLKRINMYFANLNKDAKAGDSTSTLGQCKGMFTDDPEILIDFNYWAKASYLSKMFTVHHEFGHCICNQGHSEVRSGIWDGIVDRIRFALGIGERKGYLKDGCPASLMHPYEFSEWCMYTHLEYYITDLQKSCK